MKLVEVYNKRAHAEDTLYYFLCSDYSYFHIMFLKTSYSYCLIFIRSISVAKLIKRDAE